MKPSADKNSPKDARNLKSFLQEFVDLQAKLLALLQEDLGCRDWVYLTDVPRTGSLHFQHEEWDYSVHGTGIRFRRGQLSIDANRHIERYPKAIDAGRITEYAESLNEGFLRYRGEMYEVNYQQVARALEAMHEGREVTECDEIEGKLYELV